MSIFNIHWLLSTYLPYELQIQPDMIENDMHPKFLECPDLNVNAT